MKLLSTSGFPEQSGPGPPIFRARPYTLQTSDKTPWMGYWHVAGRINTQHNTQAKTDQLYLMQDIPMCY